MGILEQARKVSEKLNLQRNGHAEPALRPVQAYEINELNEITPHSADTWNQAEAEALLADLRREVAQIQWRQWRGSFPPTIAHLVADGQAICRDLADDHEQEARRGWDVLELMHESAALTLRIARGERPPALPPMTAEEAAWICRGIERDQNLPAGSLDLLASRGYVRGQLASVYHEALGLSEAAPAA
jgi:hypothetical protein